MRGGREVLTDQVGGTAYGRPYSSGGFGISGSGLICVHHAAGDRPAEIAVIER